MIRGSSLGTRGSVDNSKFEFKPGDATVVINETESTCQINCWLLMRTFEHGFVVHGFAVHGFAVSGFVVHGFTMSAFAVHGFTMSGFAVHGFAISGFAVHGFAVLITIMQ